MTADQHNLIMTLGHLEQWQRSVEYLAEQLHWARLYSADLEKRIAMMKYDQRYLADVLADLDRCVLASSIYQCTRDVVAAARRLTGG